MSYSFVRGPTQSSLCCITNFTLFGNANGNPKRFANTGLSVIPDSMPGFAGPLAGILAGLDWLAAQSNGIEWMVSVPDDCPFLPDDLVERLHRARREIGAGGGWPARAPAKGAIR